MSELITAIRATYPAPVPYNSRADTRHQYCTGGAICLYLRGKDASRFPTVGHLAFVLKEHNPDLTAIRAMEYAEEIIDANDCARFGKAWTTAQQALDYGK